MKKNDNFIMIKCPQCPKEWIISKSLFSEGDYNVFCSECGGRYSINITLNIKIKKEEK